MRLKFYKLYAAMIAGCVGMNVGAYAQLSLKQGVAVTGANAFIVLNDLSLEHNATPVIINHTVKFTGGSNVVIKGTTAPSFSKILMNKPAATKLTLQQNITVLGSVDFNGGLIDLNGKTLALAATALLLNEKEDSRIIAPNGGLVTITITLNAPANSNPGNLGAIITSGANMGQTTIKRGHQSQIGTGFPGTIQRFYDIQPANNTNLNATLRLRYFDAELNGWAENTLALLTSTDNSKWNAFSATTRNTSQNFLDRTGVSSFARMTLGADKKAIDNSPTGIASGSQQLFGIKTWPNPANGFFFIQATTGNGSVTNFELYDAGGRLFLRKELKNDVAEKISGLPPGTYLIRATNSNGIQTGKVIVQ